MNWSQENIANDTTAVLSWHLQNFAAIEYSYNGITLKPIFHWIITLMKKYFVKWVLELKLPLHWNAQNAVLTCTNDARSEWHIYHVQVKISTYPWSIDKWPPSTHMVHEQGAQVPLPITMLVCGMVSSRESHTICWVPVINQGPSAAINSYIISYIRCKILFDICINLMIIYSVYCIH